MIREESKNSENSNKPLLKPHENMKNMNNKNQSNNSGTNEIKDYFKKKDSDKEKVKISNLGKEIKTNITKTSSTEQSLNKEEQKEIKDDVDNQLKNFIKESKKNSNLQKDLESSHKMLIELSKLNLEDVDNKNNPSPSVSNSKENKVNHEQNRPGNPDDQLISNYNDVDNNNNDDNNDGLKDDIYEDNDKEEKDDKDLNSTENIHFECPQIKFSSKDEIEELTSELSKILGERVFKASYQLVYDNVRTNLLLLIDSQRTFLLQSQHYSGKNG